MRLYVLVSFWLSTLTFVIQILAIGMSDWPRKREPESLGVAVASALIGLAFVFWAANVLWCV